MQQQTVLEIYQKEQSAKLQAVKDNSIGNWEEIQELRKELHRLKHEQMAESARIFRIAYQ